MRLAGYQPLTLIDYPEHIASIVFTQGCPFRCVYCHNPELLPIKSETDIEETDMLARIQKDASMLDGVVITGGEPTLHPDLPEFLRKIKDLGLKTKLDTNGVNPRMIERCIRENLVDFFAMDLKHRFEKYTHIIGSAPDIAIDNCEKTFRMIQDSGTGHEFRTTVYPEIHEIEDVMAIAALLHDGESYAIQPIRHQKTLVENLAQTKSMDFENLVEQLRKRFPKLIITLKG